MAKINLKFLSIFFAVALMAVNCLGQTPAQRRLINCYNDKKYAEGVAVADSLIKATGGTYQFTWVERSSIGVFRFETGDFKGAIKDFDAVISYVDTTKSHWGWTLTDAEHYKPAAHLALGQKDEAARCFEYFARRYQSIYSSWQGLVMYMENGQKAKYIEFLPVALSCYINRIKNDSLRRQNSSIAFSYVELLLVAEKPQEAMQVLYGPKLEYSDNRFIALKFGLSAVAQYLLKPADHLRIREQLKGRISEVGTTKGLEFAFLDPWIKHILKDPLKQHHIGLLLQVAKDGGY